MMQADLWNKYRWFLLPLTIAACLIGIFFRFWNLGDAPLAVDEYFLGTSTLNTAARWLPEFACGGYYTRGVLIQYLSLPLLWLGSPLEFTVRFWPAVASLLTVVAVWRIALLAGGRTVAAIAVVLVSLSLWEVEFARFGRMYAPFQAIFVWYAYFHLRHLLEGRESARWGYLGVSALGILTYEGAALLLPLNFLALVWPGKRWSVPHLAVSVSLLVVGLVNNAIDFRHFGLARDDMLPGLDVATADAVITLPFNLPTIPHPAWPILAFGLVLTAIALWRYRRSPIVWHPALAFWVLTSLALMFGLVAMGSALLVAGMLMRLPAPIRTIPLGGPVVAAGLVTVTVLWLGVLSASAWLSGQYPASSLKEALLYVLDYPDVYHYVAQPWLLTIPVTAGLLGLFVMPALWAAIRYVPVNAATSHDVLRYLFAILILLALLVAVAPQPYPITRYTYFLYPLILILAAAGIRILAARCVASAGLQLPLMLGLAASLLLLAEDFRLGHLLRINEAAIRYRTEYNPKLAEHYYVRWDFRGAAAYVNERLGPLDSVIVFDQPLPHYLDRTNGIFIRDGTDIHRMVWGCGGTRDLWSNAPLLDTTEDVEQLIEATSGSVWLVMRSERCPWRDPLEAQLAARYGDKPEFISQDGYLVVYRVAPSPAPRERRKAADRQSERQDNDHPSARLREEKLIAAMPATAGFQILED